MKIIISPAKKMKEDRDSLPHRSMPQFLPKAEIILDQLRSMSHEELKALWRCSDQLTQLNMDRLEKMDLCSAQTPALLAYEGIQYQHMAPRVFTTEALDYVQNHLRILSGLYGVLRPFDGVTPYRLEMQARLNICKAKNLYDYWNNIISYSIFQEDNCVLNLASKEYSICISKYLPPNTRFITCIFAEQQGKRLIEKGTLCKMARGEMVRFLAEHRFVHPEDAKQFCSLGYRYSEIDSTDSTYLFLKEPT